MRNTEVVRKFKVRLVRVFFEMRNQLSEKVFSAPKTMTEALRLALAQAEIIEEQAAQIEATKPHVEFVEKYVDATGSKGFRQVCKLLGANESDFRRFLNARHIMYKLGDGWTPYQPHIDCGRFEIKAGTSSTSNHAFNQARFTPKGIHWIAGEWAKFQVKDACPTAV
ncbi:hypothetical protein EYB48_05785 [Undibacterium sp. B2R-29]|nr:hypothetical protein [Undibacterium crateris]